MYLTKEYFKNISCTKAYYYDLIVFSHLRWDFVYQRPQHIISRLAKTLKVLFVEEPIGKDKDSMLIIINDNLHVFQAGLDSVEEIGCELKSYFHQCPARIAWFYSPAFTPLLKYFEFNKIVYDCMDELSLFKGASAKLSEQEDLLLKSAEIVFTGGKRLYENKKRKHRNVFCFPSSVDQKHFEKALNGISVPADAKVNKPLIGYYGVIDERIDMALLSGTAELLPEVGFVMIGPLAKINDYDLPRAPNIFYLGKKDYEFLPNYLKAFDIAMMPFAINDATKFISPTKTLEYMAADKPIISTPVYDVVRDYSNCVEIVNNAEEFYRAIKKLLSSTENDKATRQQLFKEVLTNTSWDATVEAMRNQLSKS